jgi:DNA-binding NtrC family response regulator
MHSDFKKLKEVLYELLLSDNGNEEDDIKMAQNMSSSITSNAFKKIMSEQNAKVIQIQTQTVNRNTSRLVVDALRLVDDLGEKEQAVMVESLVKDLILMEMPYNDVINFITKAYLRVLLKMTNESQTEVADRIGLSRPTYLALLDRHGMKQKKKVKEIELKEIGE